MGGCIDVLLWFAWLFVTMIGFAAAITGWERILSSATLEGRRKARFDLLVGMIITFVSTLVMILWTGER